jgi:hypothetical protein
MDRVVETPRVEDGVVWIVVRVDGLRFKMGSASAGEWNIFYPGMDPMVRDKAKAIAVAWEREHSEESAALFALAQKARKAKPKP